MPFLHKLLPTLSILILGNLFLRGQECGTIATPDPDFNYNKFDELLNAHTNKRSVVDTVSVSLFSIQKANGTGGIEESIILTELNRVNNAFKNANIYFTSCGPIRKISSSQYYELSVEEAVAFNDKYHVENTLNIYFATELFYESSGKSLCGKSSFPWNFNIRQRYILMKNSCASNGSTLAHEIGHFYGLYHTHETSMGNEFVDRRNCEYLGDLVCDTPADPKIGSSNVNSPECVYIGAERDENGELYMPDPSNLMSYAPSACRNLFTSVQIQRMRYYLETRNDYLVSNCNFPDFIIESEVQKVHTSSPESFVIEYRLALEGDFVEKGVRLDWYLSTTIESIGVFLKSEWIETQEFENAMIRSQELHIPINTNSGKYFLYARIDPLEEIIEENEENNMIIIDLNVDNSLLGDLRFFPNPVETTAFLFFKNSYKGSFYIMIFNSSGQLVQEKKRNKNGTEFLEKLELDHFSPGIYFVKCWFEENQEPVHFKFFKS